MLAEKMAKEEHQSTLQREWQEWKARYPETSEKYIKQFIPLARIALDFAAGCVKAGYNAGVDAQADYHSEPNAPKPNADHHLITNGLKEKDGKENNEH